MATKVTTGTPAQEKAGLAIAKTAYNRLGAELQAKIPEPNAENSVAFGKALAKYDPSFNCFINALEPIILGFIRSAETKNPYENLYASPVEYGGGVEEMFVDAFEAEEWGDCRTTDFKDLFGTSPAHVQTIYHTRNFSKRTKVSIKDHEIKHAFDSYANLNSVVGRIKDTLYTSMQEAEKEAAQQLLSVAVHGGWLRPVKVNAVPDVMGVSPLTEGDEQKLKKNVMIERALSTRLDVTGSRDYNPRGVLTLTPSENQMFFVTPEVFAAQDVGVLAAAFNMSKAEFLGKVITIPSFGANTEHVQGLMFDKDWFRIIPTDREVTWAYNAATRTYNYFYFVEAIYSFSLFRNAIVLTDNVQEPSVITITPGQEIYKGQQKEIDFSMTTEDNGVPYYNKCDWTIEGAMSDDTFITPGGVLYVARDESAPTLTITAKYALNNSIASSPAAVTVRA